MAGIPARPPIKPTGREIADPFNKSGIFAGAATGSGTAKYQPKPKVPKSPRGQASYNVQAKKSGTFQGGPTGSGVVKDQWVGEGADKRYVQVPEPVKGSGGPVPPSYNQTKRNAAAAGIDAGTSRNAPKRSPKTATTPKDQGDSRGTPTSATTTAPKSDTGSSAKASTSAATTSSKPAGGEKPKKSAPAVPGTLNYFMQMTMKDGKKNSRNRAYQMFKNYKKSGKLPGDMGSATQ